MLRGHDIHSARNAKDGLFAYKVRQPDIVLLDIGLPDKSGHDVLKEIIKEYPNAFVAMVTGSSVRNDVTLAMQNGAKAYIVKPFSKRQIQEVIDNYYIHIGKKP